MKDYPKILIFYQPFNSYSGGGITLTNLFLGWPKERLAVLSYPFMLNEVSGKSAEIIINWGIKNLDGFSH
jgi:hypothetical protein